MTTSTQHAVYSRPDWTLTIHDQDNTRPPRTVEFGPDLDAALADAAFVRIGQWQRTTFGTLVADVELA